MANITLKGMTWLHARGLDPLVAASKVFAENIGVQINWVARSLSDFELFPMEQLAAEYDMIMIDHPHIGISHAESLLQPLETLLPEELLADQKENSVGQSYASYTWEGHQYALPLDAAAQVSAYRKDLLEALPTTWGEVLALAKENPEKVAIPFVPVHAYSSFYTLCSHFSEGIVWSDGSDLSEEAGVKALEILTELLAVANKESKDMDPINMLDKMCQGNEIIYSPLVYGYSNYARKGYAKYVVNFGDMPRHESQQSPKGSMIGGVGLALSTKCQEREAAIAFMKFVAPAEAQMGLLFDAGGQPGHKKAWEDGRVNELSNNFFAGTLETLMLGSMRPRFAGYVDFQAEAGSRIREFVVNGTGDKAAFVKELNELIKTYRK
ncbi:MAG: extracellular solute-binding protein [Rikenellaceae bacterium]